MKPGQAHQFTGDNVTIHAVLRYVQRVLGVTVSLDLDATSIKERAQIHCEAAGLTIAQVKALILTPAMCTALALRAHAVRTARYAAILDPDQQMVITILICLHGPALVSAKNYASGAHNKRRRIDHPYGRRPDSHHARELFDE